MNKDKRQKKFTILIIQDERLVYSFKFSLNFLKICAVAVVGFIILSSAAIFIHNNMRASNKEELIAKTEPKNNPVELKNNEEKDRIAAHAYNLAIEDFSSRFDMSRKLFRYSFLLKNKDAKSATVSGYLFVVLKSEDLSPEQWLSHPPTDLVNGVPQNFRRGDPFSITRQKAITKDITVPHKYDFTSIFVFAHDGTLIFEKNFSVK